jgi:hypothetical protein
MVLNGSWGGGAYMSGVRQLKKFADSAEILITFAKTEEFFANMEMFIQKEIS